MDIHDSEEYAVTASTAKNGTIIIERTKSKTTYSRGSRLAKSIFDAAGATDLKKKSQGARFTFDSVKVPKKKDEYLHVKIPTNDLKLILPHLTIDLTASTSYALISKLGIRKLDDLIKAKNDFFKKMTKSQMAKFIDPAFMKKVISEFPKKRKIVISTTGRKMQKVDSNKKDPKNPKRKVQVYKFMPEITQKALTAPASALLAETLVKLYAIYANRLCTAMGKDYEKYGQPIISRAILGTLIGGKLPAGFKDAFKESAKLKLNAGLNIEKLKPSHFKGASGQALVNALPQMYDEYFKGHSAKKSSDKKIEKLRANLKELQAKRIALRNSLALSKGYSYAKMRIIDNKIWDVKAAIRKARTGSTSRYAKISPTATAKMKVNEALFNAVGAEMYGFYRMVIPALKPVKNSPFLNKKENKTGGGNAELLAQRIRTLQWKLKSRMRPLGPKARKTVQEEIKTLTAQKKAAKEEAKPTIKTWMVPYLGTDIAINTNTKGKVKRTTLDDGLIAHRLVTRANAGKLKKNDIELTVELDKNNALMLTLGGVSRIVTMCGSSIQAFTTVFKNVDKEVRAKAFIADFSENSIGALETDTGKVSNSRLLRLNGVSQEEQIALEKNYKKEIAAWNPLKQELADYIKAITNSAEAKAQHFTVTKSSTKELAENRKMIKKFFSFTHGVKELRVNKSWEVQPSKQQAAILKNAANGAKLQVIQNVFHGTPRQAGSIILARGFKLAGTKVTARSMGEVLYIAPNADKSAQYMRSGGAFNTGVVTGMIFMGDCIVGGEPKRMIDKGSNTGFGWTKTGAFKTEEIGLVNPNSQFIIRKAMIVTMEKTSKSTPRRVLRQPPIIVSPNGNAQVQGVTKFEDRIPLKTYHANRVPASAEMKPKKVSKKDVEKKIAKAPVKKAKKN